MLDLSAWRMHSMDEALQARAFEIEELKDKFTQAHFENDVVDAS